MPWVVVARNVLESMAFQESEKDREAKTDTEMEKDRQEGVRPAMAGEERKGGRDTENDGKRSGREGEVSKPAVSQPIKSLEWEEGARETLTSARAGHGSAQREGGGQGLGLLFFQELR